VEIPHLQRKLISNERSSRAVSSDKCISLRIPWAGLLDKRRKSFSQRFTKKLEDPNYTRSLIFVSTLPAQHAFSPLLLSVLAVEHCCWIRVAPLSRKRPCYAIAHGKDAERCGWWVWEKRRVTDCAAEQGLLQLYQLLERTFFPSRSFTCSFIEG